MCVWYIASYRGEVAPQWTYQHGASRSPLPPSRGGREGEGRGPRTAASGRRWLLQTNYLTIKFYIHLHRHSLLRLLLAPSQLQSLDYYTIWVLSTVTPFYITFTYRHSNLNYINGFVCGFSIDHYEKFTTFSSCFITKNIQILKKQNIVCYFFYHLTKQSYKREFRKFFNILNIYDTYINTTVSLYKIIIHVTDFQSTTNTMIKIIKKTHY